LALRGFNCQAACGVVKQHRVWEVLARGVISPCWLSL
jgi:hypothetical protein